MNENNELESQKAEEDGENNPVDVSPSSRPEEIKEKDLEEASIEDLRKFLEKPRMKILVIKDDESEQLFEVLRS